MTRRALVAKTYKLYVGGAFARSESGRSDAATDASGAHVANVPRASRKDVRDAVKAARGAVPKWAGKTAYNRGQVLYRFAEALESRAEELARQAVERQGAAAAGAREELGAAVDTLVHYAGWTDKLAPVMGGINPVAMPYLSFSAPEPTGVVAVIAPDEPDVLGLIREVAPALAAGNTVVALISRRWPLRALDLGEIAGVSDVPAGALNLLSGRLDELVAPLCGHRDVNAIVDASGVARVEDHDRPACGGDRQAREPAPRRRRRGRVRAAAPRGAHRAQDRVASGGDLVPEPVVMSAAALEALHAELARLEGEGRREIAERIRTAREWGDLKENAEYHDAKKSQAMLETRILQLRETALLAELREEQSGGEAAGLGSRVTVADEATGRESVYALVSATESDPAQGAVSFQSPMGRALDGARVGDTVVVTTPKGERRLAVRGIA